MYGLAGLLGVGLLMTGCASTSQSTDIPDQTRQIQDPAKARIYLMRGTKFWGNGDAIQLALVDKHAEARQVGYTPDLLGELGPGHYLCVENLPGIVVITTVQANPDTDVTLKLVAGHVYYVRLSVGAGFDGPTAVLKTVSEEEGRSLLKHCKPPKH